MSSGSPSEVWCVWALVPRGPKADSKDGWSMIHNGMTQVEAERAVETSMFRARAMVAGKSAGFRPAALEPKRAPHPLDPGVTTHVTVDAAPAQRQVDDALGALAASLKRAPKREPATAPAPPGQGVTISFRRP